MKTKKIKETKSNLKVIQIEKKLQYIYKNGDLYDMIAKKKNAIPDTFERKLVKMHTIIFSRILYLMLVLSRRIKNSFTPLEKVKQMHDEIRRSIGVPIDIVRTKEKNGKLGISYCNYDLEGLSIYPDVEDLINDLRKINSFAKEYHIDDIYIESYYLSRYLSDNFLRQFPSLFHSELLKHEAAGQRSYLLLKTNQKGLDEIITNLKENKYDTAFVYSMKSKLKNEILKDAIEEFKKNNDGNKLIETTRRELSKLINEESTTKDREYGKVHNVYEIGSTFLRKTSNDSKGNFISQNIMSLYNFLEVTNYSHLENVASIESEEQELKLESLLYLNLLGEKAREKRSKIEINSLYDYIYNEYKKNQHRKRIPWIYSFFEKRKAEKTVYTASLVTVILSYGLAMIITHLLNLGLPSDSKFLNNYNNLVDKIEKSYEDSSDFEKSIKKNIQQFIEKLFPNHSKKDMQETYQSSVKEEYKDHENGKVAEIEWFSKEKMPVYFVAQYSESGRFYDGQFNFWMKDPHVNLWNIASTRPLFQIKCPLSKGKLNEILGRVYFRLPLEVYPAGDDYAITQIYIKDEKDPTKYLKIDSTWNDTHSSELTSDEKDLLRSMEEPMVYYIYGLSNEESQISFDVDYSEISYQLVKDAILDGLNLDYDASDEEINKKIAEKDYTKYPLYNKKNDIGELEYYKKIASLAAIDIDMASVLTTLANTNSIYASGFKNANEDDTILLDEAYTWVMNEDGEIIDFLSNFKNEGEPTLEVEETQDLGFVDDSGNSNNTQDKENDNGTNKTQEKDEEESSLEQDHNEEDSRVEIIFTKIANWGKQYHIPYFVALYVALLIIKKMFGEKIKYKLRLIKANNILSSEDFNETYNELFQFVYGEEIEPTWKTKSKMLDAITKEFYAFDEEHINSLLDELRPLVKSNKENVGLKKAEELLKMMPFIKENKDTLENYKPKKLTLGGKYEK